MTSITDILVDGQDVDKAELRTYFKAREGWRVATAEALGFKTDGSLNDTAMTNFLASNYQEVVFQSGATYTFGARINITVNNKRLRADGPDYAYFDFPGVLGVSSGTAHLIYGTGRSNVSLEGISAAGDATSFTNNGFDTYGILFTSSSNIHLKRVRATGVENGVIFGSGMSDSSMEDVVGYNCYCHSVGSWGTSGNPNRRLTLKNLRGYSNQSVEHLAPVSGVYVEETYDSHLENLTGYNCNVGVRIENSCDNTIIGVQGYDNWACGAEIYNVAQRNVVTGVRVWNNNRGNRDALDTTTRGNDNTKFSGLNIEGTSDNNVVCGVVAFQTKATIVPFNSGSAEPWLGSMLQGATSNKLGRVRRIVVTSGTWGGGDAAGFFHLVENDGAFNGSEIIKNVTTRVPYNSGSDKPRAGDTLTGATSGATGVVLWVSQQSGAAGDWSLGNSDGYIYLTGVSGTFNAAENLNNTTLSQNNIATTNGAATAAAADIATTNGATTLGRANGDGTYGRGFQKYGIGVNVRNLPTVNDGDSYNVFSGVQCFNNDVAQISDRGYMNVFEAVNEYNVSLIRSA
jgi:hypothetical protein